MHVDFWHQRWENADIGFHEPRPLPLLCKHWPPMPLAPGARVFVPLCGKSLDMTWLAEQGHDVLGVELSSLAVEAFFAEHALVPDIFETRYGRHSAADWRGQRIELICGDVFALDAEALSACDAFYDRAALVALPPNLRERYVALLDGALPSRCSGLLITLEYDQEQMAGPPFAVHENEVRAAFGSKCDVALLERRDILREEPGFARRGLTRMDTAVYCLRQRGAMSV